MTLGSSLKLVILELAYKMSGIADLTAAVDTMLGHGWPFIAACGAVLLVVPSIVIRIVSSMLATSEQRRDVLFSRTPYGLENNAIMQSDFSQQDNRFGLLRNRQIQYLRDTDLDL